MYDSYHEGSKRLGWGISMTLSKMHFKNRHKKFQHFAQGSCCEKSHIVINDITGIQPAVMVVRINQRLVDIAPSLFYGLHDLSTGPL